MPDEIIDISSAEHFKALGHPMRHRLLFALGRNPATVSQLAAALGSHKGNIAHHLKVLHEAGLIQEAGTRQVRGGTERYYRRTARAFRFVGEHAPANLAVAFQAVAEEISTAEPDPFLTLRHLRLSPEQASQVTAILTSLAETEEAGEDDSRYGLLLGLYRQPPAPGASRG